MKLVELWRLTNSQRKQIAGARPRLFRVALAWCGDEMLADELVQEALALGLQKVHQLRDPDRLNARLYSNLIITGSNACAGSDPMESWASSTPVNTRCPIPLPANSKP